MSKTMSIVLISIIVAIALFFGVFSCLPGGLEYGDYNIYNAPINLIQGDSLFTDSVKATYKVKLDDEADINQVAACIRTRLAQAYGYYFSNVKVDGENIIIQVPVTAKESDTSETSVLSNVTQNGKVEILTSNSYSESNVILTSEHVSSTSIRSYVSGGSSAYIVNLKLTKEGKEIAANKLTATSNNYSAFLAIDGTVTNGIMYSTNGTLQVYAQGDAQCASIAGLVRSGALNAKLTALDTEEVSSCGGLIFAIVVAAIVLGSWIFYLAKYGKVAIAAIVSQLIAVVVFIMCAGMITGRAAFVLLNIPSAIGIVLGYCLMSAFTCLVLGKLRGYSDKTYNSARYLAFKQYNVLNCIVHVAVLVVGIVMWLIHTGVTAPLGCALVYCVILSFVVTMLLNRLFTRVVAPLCENK